MELSEKDRKALKAAVLTHDGFKQEEITSLIGVSQGEVSRLLAHAKERKWLNWTVDWPPELSHDQRDAIEQEAGFTGLAKLHAKITKWTVGGFAPLRDLRVITTANSGDSSRLFGRRAADEVVRLLDDAQSSAVAWGTTVQSVVDAIPRQKKPTDAEADTAEAKEFLPICGEPLNFREFGLSPSVAAANLAKAYGIDPDTVPSLQGVPARVPADLESGMKVLSEFALKSRAYSSIFSPADNPRIANVDMILTGVGNAETSSSDPWFLETFEAERGPNLHDISSGNIAGLWLPKPDSTNDDRRTLDEINSHWLGISLDHMKQVAGRGVTQHVPGVVVVASQANKRDIIRAALPMINYLIISSELGRALLALE